MRHDALVLTGIAGVLLASLVVSGQSPDLRITYLYDNTAAVSGTQADWGFACLVESRGHTVLFDTGTKPEILSHNLATLKVALSRVQALVFSHEHGDHTMGLAALPAMPGLPVYIGEHFRLPPPAAEALTRIGAKRITVGTERSAEVFPGITVTREFVTGGPHEEALVVETPRGSVVIVGCAHPGIISMLKDIAESTKRPISMVLGGFHLMQTPADDVKRMVAEFKALGVEWAGPTHCTGDEAIRLFREAYGDHFIPGGVGTVISRGAELR
jgi:7,8-dihydropterin-6-yl-methyl-4-(beta-D-ribofuranosyl)aminobenzene 5'-phosphate synthase